MWGRAAGLIAATVLALGTVTSPAGAALQNEFITTWDTSIVGSSNAQTLTLPLVAGGTYDFYTDWGDASPVTHVTGSSAQHVYATAGTYTVKITGTIDGWRFGYGGDAPKLLTVSHWGPLRLGNAGGYFAGASNLTVTATDAPDLTGTTNMSAAFGDCPKLTGGLATWNMSGVTDMSAMFQRAYLYNEDLSGWNTSNVTNLTNTFSEAHAFNGDISTWDTSKVTSLSGTFDTAYNFDRNIGGWNTSAVTSLNGTFYNANRFNQPIGSWDTANVTDMKWVFAGDTLFNQPIGSWNTSKATSFYQAFAMARNFNQDISGWDTSHITNMDTMFAAASKFDQNLGPWDVSKVTNMSQMLRDSGMRPPNYDKILIAWAAQDVRNSVPFWGYSRYASDAAVTARAHLTGTHLWSISDQGRAPAPSAPTNVTGTGGDHSITLTWTDSPASYYVPIDSYTATAAPGGATCTATTGGCTIPGLANGTGYTVTVTATTPAGTSTPSMATATIVPLGRAGAPQSVTLQPGHRQIAVAWTPPADDGGAAITGYTATAEPGGATCTATADTCTLMGLANATAYTVTVRATTAAGDGTAGEPVVTMTQAAWPQTGAPRIARAVHASGKTVLLRKAVTTNAGQRATAVVTAPKKAARVRITGKGKVVLTSLRTKPYRVRIRLTAPATDDYAAYTYTHRWRVRP